MIGTIGSLVQETFKRWLLAVSLYFIACISTSLLFGAFLGAAGYFVHTLACGSTNCKPLITVEAIITGLFALAYAVSDVGLLHLPRPSLMYGVPATWWQRWRPYGAALAYGGALGLGLTTYITFGAFYVLCAWCIVVGNISYGALLMGTYGVARALILIPASWGVYGRPEARDVHINWILSQVSNARAIVAFVLIAFGLQVLLATII